MTRRVLAIEPSAARRAALTEYLHERDLEIYTAQGAADALPLLAALTPDITLIDLDLPNEEGYSLIAAAGAIGSLSMVASREITAEERMRALSQGAQFFISAGATLEELELRIRNIFQCIARMQSANANPVVDLSGVRVDLVSRSVLGRSGAPGAELTDSEFSLLRLLTDNQDRIVSKEALFRAIHEGDYSPTTRSLDVCVSRLRIKLKSSDAGVEIRSVRQAGYMLTRLQAPELQRPRSRTA